MNILLYSTSTVIYDKNKNINTTLPLWSEQWQKAAEKYNEHNIIIATQLPGMFLTDVKQNEIFSKAKSIRYEIIQEDNEEKIAEFLIAILNQFLP